MPDAGRYLTPPQIADRLACKPETVIGWIRTGELAAINLARPGCIKPRYRVSPQALADFELRRSVVPRAQPSSARRRHSTAIKRYV